MLGRLAFLIVLLSLAARSAAAADPLQQKLSDALTELSYVNSDRAYVLFSQIVPQTPEGSVPWQQAIYGQALCAQQISPPTKSRIDQATALYQRLIDKAPDSRFTPRAIMNLGRIAELRDYGDDKVDLQGARAYYQQVLDRWPNNAIAGEATLRIAATFIQTYDHDQVRKGISILEAWLASHPKEELASTMWQYLGDSYFFPLKEYAKAVECYDKADAIGWMDKGNQGPIYWRVACLAEKKLANRDVAVKYYTKIIKETPNSGKAYESQLALKRLSAPVPPITILKRTEGQDAN